MSMFGGGGNNNDYNTSSSQFSGTQVGGGFVGTGNENDFGSANNASNKRIVPMNERRLSPLTLKQLQNASPPDQDENLVIDTVEVSQIHCIGEIEQIDIQSSHTTLTINDGTATMNVKQWHNNDEDAKMETLSEGAYIKVFGRPNVYNGNISINAFKIEPIADFNEVTLHFIECLYAHKVNSTAPKLDQDNPMSGGSGNNNMSSNNAMNTSNLFGGGDDNDLTPLQNEIMRLVRSYDQSEAGCGCDRIFDKLPNHDMGDIRTNIEELTTQGMIYSTIDEEHFKSTTN